MNGPKLPNPILPSQGRSPLEKIPKSRLECCTASAVNVLTKIQNPTSPPLSAGNPEYFQIGACIYLLSSDDEISTLSPAGEGMYGEAVMPGFYLDAEVGLGNIVSFTLAMVASSMSGF